MMRVAGFTTLLIFMMLVWVTGCASGFDDPKGGNSDQPSEDASVGREPEVVATKDATAGSPDAAESIGATDAGVGEGLDASGRDGGDPNWMTQAMSAPDLLITDGENIFWTSPTSVHACPIGNSCPSPVTLGANQPSPAAISTDGTNVYWTTIDDAARGRGSIRYRARDGSGTAPVTIASNQVRPRCVAGGNGFVFWCTSQAAQNRNIHRIPIAGGDEIALRAGDGTIEAMVLEAMSNQLVWGNQAGALSTVTVQFAPNTQRTEQTTPLLTAPTFAVANAGYVYWVEGGEAAQPGRILRQRMAPAAGPLEVVFSGSATIRVKAISISMTSLIFTASIDGNAASDVYKLDLAQLPAAAEGLTSILHAVAPTTYSGVLALNGFIYVADPANNRILRILE